MQNDENTNALFIHLSAFLGYFFPLGSIIAPLILWQLFKSDSPFLNQHGKQAVNFNLSFTLYLFIATVVFLLFLFGFFFGSFINIYNETDFNFNENYAYYGIFSVIGLVIGGFSMTAILLSRIVLIIIACVKANKGEEYHYPFTINFLK
ncbi:DUF4870 domain-containing protein [Tenacibaculum piscium]|uniref:DUF4870 domain-containing protein n=2 Tax=Tenacibaculum piscium TaxID=1458515 RepID=A0A2H1YIE7_9FLAO|nr:DUF4870 domain-containing protein [Tenacibaculum piscium]MBE7628484.1 DUF4870 domain-containing protein [Tenacibaculum piscium]MBE7669624.1 DUF4870 domain-containing protein [Tenacibaculum piscium]MBE7684791.1 DUF4870 domain-containing protein [Tenacibaculum piscium]MBE7689410.1 DUF4870 domain-containing protein [Tenacibaculum piscium]SOS75272.1 conserved membrane hypothetical protein [Tenacibaculum piscium]